MSDLHAVHLLQLPVRIWAQAQETTEALLREFTLISLGGDLQTHEVPARLLALIDVMTDRFQGIATEQELALRDAAESGRMVIEDLRYDVPAEVSEGVQALGALLDEADAYCEQGKHLLTVAAAPEVVRFRQWFLAQFSEQVAGRPATAWPDWP